MNSLAPRKFGIELEISRRLVNIAYHDRKKSLIWDELRTRLEMLKRDGYISYGWKVKTDTSCGGELVSPPMFAPDGLRETAAVCKMVKTLGKDFGKPIVDGECGLHIHFDASDMKPRHLSNLFVILHMAEPIIFAMYPNRNFEYCAPIDINMKMGERLRDWLDVRDLWYRSSNNVKDKSYIYPDDFIASTAPGDNYDGTRYHGFNIHCYWKLGTVEFRYGCGTFDIGHIRAYYEMCLSMVNTAISSPRRLKMLDGISGKKYSKLLAYYHSNYRGRRYIRELAKMCGFSRNTIKLIIDTVKQNNPSLLQKDPATIPAFVTEENKMEFFYTCVEDGYIYRGDGKLATNDDLSMAPYRDDDGKLKLPETKRRLTVGLGDDGFFTSLDNKVHLDVKIRPANVVKKKSKLPEHTYFFKPKNTTVIF